MPLQTHHAQCGLDVLHSTQKGAATDGPVRWTKPTHVQAYKLELPQLILLSPLPYPPSLAHRDHLPSATLISNSFAHCIKNKNSPKKCREKEN